MAISVKSIAVRKSQIIFCGFIGRRLGVLAHGLQGPGQIVGHRDDVAGKGGGQGAKLAVFNQVGLLEGGVQGNGHRRTGVMTEYVTALDR